ncbi:MAG TPA: amidohydrolase family protein, partial [Pyrinomonadaceae bacterium]|nr:amidohydrolase family protein [Pyrinomonadaceae bacterium]
MQNQSSKIVYAGRLIDGVSDRVQTNMSVIIEGGRIREVLSGKVSLPDAEIVDLSESTVMPGFIDCHTHTTFQLDKGRTLKDLVLSRNADLAIEATNYVRRTLLAGFTTVRDV